MDQTCCPEYAAVSRRGFLSGAAALVGTTTVFGSTLLTVPPAGAATTGSTLVVLSLRGAADGLSLVVPHGDPVYYAARPRIAVPADATHAMGLRSGATHPRRAATDSNRSRL